MADQAPINVLGEVMLKFLRNVAILRGIMRMLRRRRRV